MTSERFQQLGCGCGNVPSSSSASGSSGSGGDCEASDDTNIDLLTAYNADGNTSAVTAVNPRTTDQTTQYVYGTDLTNSDIASTLLLREEILPDSVDADDVKRYKYNRQSERTEFQDQNGTVHAYVYDLLGRLIHDRVTTAGTGIDTAVLRISTTYEVRGMVEKLTSHDNATVGSGAIVNEVLFKYNAFGQLTHDYQSHSGAVNTSTTPVVRYVHADGSSNTIRQTTLIYPDGRQLHSSYGTTNGINDAASRVASLIDDDGTTHLADYAYLGDGIFVEVDYTEPDVKWTMIRLEGGNDPDTGDIYGGFDRFTRIKDNRWFNYNTNEDVDRLLYGYDRASNRLWRENPVAAALGKHFDELYTYDGNHRLKSMQRGDLNAQKTAITNGTFAECWTLDAVGNWPGYRQDADGTTSWDLVQSRTANKVNEITAITNSVGAGWAQPAYDRAGNMTTIPKPEDPTSAFTGVYDAWDRLVRLSAGVNTVSEHAYDGAKRRVVQKSYSGGVLSETRHLFYTEPRQWQAIEECVGSASTADRQFVFGSRYLDDLVLRDRGEERLYALQDENWNVSCTIEDSATVADRFAYSSYGIPLFLTSGFAQASSAHDLEHLFAGYRWDLTTSLLHVRFRLLLSVLGTWTTRDPLRMNAGITLYEYCFSRPNTLMDPGGLKAVIDYPIRPEPPEGFQSLDPFEWMRWYGKYLQYMGKRLTIPRRQRGRLGLYDGSEYRNRPFDPKRRAADSGQLMGIAVHDCGPDNVVDISKPDWPTVAGAVAKREGCISHLVIVDHGGAGGAQFGHDPAEINATDIAAFCGLLCEGATIRLRVCSAALGNQKTINLIFAHCPKVTRILAPNNLCKGMEDRWWGCRDPHAIRIDPCVDHYYVGDGGYYETFWRPNEDSTYDTYIYP